MSMQLTPIHTALLSPAPVEMGMSSPTTRIAVNEENPDQIPTDIAQPTTSDKVCFFVEDSIRLGGGSSFGVLAIWSGITAGASAFTVAATATSLAFFILHIVDKTCGRGNTATELLNRSVTWYSRLQQEQRRLITDQQSTVVATRQVTQDIQIAAQTTAVINQAGAADTNQLGQTVAELQQGISSMGPARDELEGLLKQSQLENQSLKDQIAKFSELFTKFQTQVQTVSQTLPELQQIDLSWDNSINSFKENSSKILDGFQSILSQMSNHSELIQSLTAQKEGLEKQLKAIQTEVDEMKENNASLNQENSQLASTNKNLTVLNETLTALGSKLDQDDRDLEERKALFIQDQAQWQQLSQTVQRASTSMQSAMGSSVTADIQALIKENQDSLARQASLLEEGKL